MTYMRTEDAIHGLMGVSARTVSLLSWMLVALVHMALLLLALSAAWFWQVTPAAVARAFQALVPAGLQASGAEILGFLGLPAAAVLWAYARAWRWLLEKLSSRYVLDFE